ncbi:hypothetical protein [Billgrantia lactosivorans]|uniref:hypothetical protein n=1 Tax=Billgrantia lactosivorans TaxID=2185141 RepID=UPI0013A68FB4|nr:hypothetical protein [Halomonas lactosivorans]
MVRHTLVVSSYVLTSTLFVQIVLLGIIFPNWGDGNGLIPGQDVTRFHQVAVEQAEAITLIGWSAWELRPNGWGISGLMSAWYVLTLPQPWVLAPIQALLYGVSVALLAKLILAATDNRRFTLLAVLPVVLLPSAAIIYAQPHRDLYIMFGLLLAIYGWWLLLRMQQAPLGQALQLATGGVGLIASGFIVSWVVREFSAEIFQGLGALFVLLLSICSYRSLRQSPKYVICAVASPLVALLLLLAMASFHSGDFFTGELEASPESAGLQVQPLEQEEHWRSSSWLPSRLDDTLRRLAGARDHFIRGYSHGRTAIDTDVHYRDVLDVLAYTPRAVQIGLFSPFPNQWLPHPEAEPVRNAYRVLAGAEMALLYLVLPFLLYAGWCWWRRPAFWVLLMPALAWVMVYAYTVPVVGSLVRYRFPGYIILVALALAGLGQAVVHWRSARRRRLTAQP